MKRWFVCLAAAIAVAGLSTLSFAAIQNSHHDMNTWLGSNGDTCYPCHGVKVDSGTLPDGLGTVGSLCYMRCHNGTGGYTTLSTLATMYPYVINGLAADNGVTATRSYGAAPEDKYNSGHGFVNGSGVIPVPDTASTVTATNWPYTQTTNTPLECTSCHDVHSNANTPFIRAPLSAATQAESFCQKCHAGNGSGDYTQRWVDITAAPNGSHPSEVTYTGAATRATTDTNGRQNRNITFKDPDNTVFRVVSPSGTALNGGQGVGRYVPGGKLSSFASSGGKVGCYTCHATHLPTAAGMSQLIVGKYAGAGGTKVDNATDSFLCVGCHGAKASIANPGATAYYHPVESESLYVSGTGNATVWTVSTGTFTITVNLDNTTPRGYTNNRLICASCHTMAAWSQTGIFNSSKAGVHAGPSGTMLLNPYKKTCEACHNTIVKQSGLGTNSHHVYGGTENYTSQYAATVRYNSQNVPGFPSGVVANLADGLQCNDCHVFNGTAHNWN